MKCLGPQKGAFGTHVRGPFLTLHTHRNDRLSICLYWWSLLLQSISNHVCHWPNRCVLSHAGICQTSSTAQDPHVSTTVDLLSQYGDPFKWDLCFVQSSLWILCCGLPESPFSFFFPRTETKHPVSIWLLYSIAIGNMLRLLWRYQCLSVFCNSGLSCNKCFSCTRVMLEKAGQSFFQWEGLDLVFFVDVLLGVTVSLTTGGGGLGKLLCCYCCFFISVWLFY